MVEHCTKAWRLVDEIPVCLAPPVQSQQNFVIQCKRYGLLGMWFD